mmetsp:Transcript_26071/g.60133  ORF Transcript_26071/g.60133 Transcript_26071/m.60133 type:complete len:242 (+) Transcript_26071:69-794(+)
MLVNFRLLPRSIRHATVILQLRTVLKEIVCGNLLLLVTSEVGLQCDLPAETQLFQALQSSTLLRGDLNVLHAWRRRLHTLHSLHSLHQSLHSGQHPARVGAGRVRLIDKPHELFPVLSDQTQQLRLLLAQLLKQRLEELGALLHNLAQHLELRVQAEHVQRTTLASGGRRWRSACGSGCGGCCGCCGGGCLCCGGRSSRWCLWLGLRNPRHQILHSSVRVVESSAHRPQNCLAIEAHLHDL